MNSYKCTKCPETMSSKCPATRNTFPTHTFVTMVANNVVMKTKPYNERSDNVCLSLEWGIGPPEVTAREIFADMVHTIRSFTDEEAAILVCVHDWEVIGEEVALG